MLRTREGGNATPLSVHPAANIFPPIEGPEFEALVEDIREHGLLHPITVHPETEDILDGRNRYRACIEAGVPVELSYWDGEPGTELAWVLSQNLMRRHLNDSQRGIVAARMKAYLEPAAKARAGARTDLRAQVRDGAEDEEPEDFGKAAEAACAALNVSARTVENAARVLARGAPELVAAVERGEVRARPAAAIATLSPEEQAALVARGPDEIIAAAKEIERSRRGTTRSSLTSSETDEHYTPEVPRDAEEPRRGEGGSASWVRRGPRADAGSRWSSTTGPVVASSRRCATALRGPPSVRGSRSTTRSCSPSPATRLSHPPTRGREG